MPIIGVDTNPSGGADNYPNGFISGIRLQMPEDGTITKIFGWVRSDNISGAAFRFLIDEGDASAPDDSAPSRLYYSPSDISLTSTSDTAYEHTLSTPLFVPSGTYLWCGMQDVGGEVRFIYGTGPGNLIYDAYYGGGSIPPPDPLPTGDLSFYPGDRYGMWLEYTAGGGGGTAAVVSVDTPIRSGSTGNDYETEDMGTSTSITIGSLAATSISETANVGTFSVPALTDETAHELYGTRTITFSDGTDSPTDSVSFLPATGWDYVVLGDSINDTETGIVYEFDPAAVENDQLVYDPTKITPDEDANAEISHTGTQTLWHIEYATKIARSYTLTTGALNTLAANLTSVSTVSGNIQTAIFLAAQTTSVATVTAPLTTAIRFGATTAGVSTVTAALTTAATFAANLTAISSVTAALSTPITFGAALTSTASSTAALTTAIRFQSDLTAVSSITANLLSPAAFGATLTSLSTVGAALSTGIEFSSDLTSISTVSAGLTTQIRMAATTAAQSSLTASLVVPVVFRASLVGLSTVTASLTGGEPVIDDNIVRFLEANDLVGSGVTLSTIGVKNPVTSLRARTL